MNNSHICKKKPIKIMYVMDYFFGPQGGTELQVIELIKGLDKNCFEPSITFLQPTDYVTKNGFTCPFQILNIKKSFSFGALRKLLGFSRSLKKSRINIVHIFFNDAALTVPFFGMLGGASVVAARRDMGFWYTPIKLSILRLSNLFVDRIVANANAVKNNVIANEHFPDNKIEVIYNGLDPQRFNTSPQEDFNTSICNIGNRLIVGMVSNLYEIKRPSDLIKAFSIIEKSFDQSHLVFVGGGTREIAPLEELTENLHLGQKVHFLGRISNPISVIKYFTVGVLCSESEGLSNAILEYLGCGKPVVCTNTGGNQELIKDGYNGFIVEVGDVDALADRISKLLSDRDLATKMSINAQRSFTEVFTSNKMAESYMKLYKKLVVNH